MKQQRGTARPLSFRVTVDHPDKPATVYEHVNGWTIQGLDGILSLTMDNSDVHLIPAGQWTHAKVEIAGLSL